MEDNTVTIERIMYGDDCTTTLFRLSDGEIINEDEAVNYVRKGKLSGVVVIKDENGQHHIKPTGHENNAFK